MPQTVILLSDVPGLGQVGDQKKVKDGYARNYLLPQRLAVVATPNAVNRFERQKEKISTERENQLGQAKSLAEKVSKVGLVFERPVGPGGRLFGSVTSLDIANELAKQGASVERKSVLMHGPIKSAGDHKIKVRIHSKVVVDIPVKVAGTAQKNNVVDELRADAEERAAEAAANAVAPSENPLERAAAPEADEE
jgi:large subunit ribosomal protein L9